MGDMEAMEATMEAMEVTDGANRPTQSIINHRPTTSFYIQISKNLEKKIVINNKNNQKNKYCHHHLKSVQDQTCIEKQNMYDFTIFLIVFFVQLSTQKYFCT